MAVNMAAGEYSLRVLPQSLSTLHNLRSLSLLKCGVHGFSHSLEDLTSLQRLTVRNSLSFPTSQRLPLLPDSLPVHAGMCLV